jgi:hypothetical protein
MLSACEKLKIHDVLMENAGKSRREIVKNGIKNRCFSFIEEDYRKTAFVFLNFSP